MQTCNCSNTYKYQEECVICGSPWETKTLEKYIEELKHEAEESEKNYSQKEDLLDGALCKYKALLVREIIRRLEGLEDQ